MLTMPIPRVDRSQRASLNGFNRAGVSYAFGWLSQLLPRSSAYKALVP